MTKAIDVRSIDKTFARGAPVLRDVTIEIARGEMVALIGASGSGKSTLIRCIAGLTPIDSSGGTISILGETVQADGRIARTAGAVRPRVGIVFQQFNLVPRLPALTNVLIGALGIMPGWRGSLGLFRREEKLRAMQALHRVGIAQHALKRGSALSGGQQQRAAIARCLMQGSDVLIADEPIASLDPNSARRVMDILAELNRVDGITVLVSLHQVEYAINYCPRAIALRDGEVVFDGPSERLTPAFLNKLYGAESGALILPGLEARRPLRAGADYRGSSADSVPAVT